MMNRAFIVVIALGLLPFSAGAFAIPKADVVVDQVGVFQNLEAVKTDLVTYQQQTGHEIAVLVVATLEGEPIEMVANEVFRDWGIGDEERNDGALIVVAVDDREARIEVGYGLEGALPDLLARRIIDEAMIPYFKTNQYGEGITAGIEVIKSSIAGEPVFPKTPETGQGDINPVFLITLAIFMGNFFWMVFGRSKAWWHGGVFGGVVGVIIGLIIGTVITTGIAIVAGILIGLIFDFIASKYYKPPTNGSGGSGPWFFGGGGFGSGGLGGGGFGGFGGGSSGGGGASGRW